MNHRIFILLLSWVALSAFSGPLPAAFSKADNEAIVHNLSSYVFPSQLMGFISKDKFVIEYKADDNVSVGYNFYGMNPTPDSTPQIMITVYVYNVKYHNSADGNASTVEQINGQILDEVNVLHNHSLKNLKTEPVLVKCGSKGQSGLYDKFETEPFGGAADPKKPLMGEIYLFAVDPWIVEFRITNAFGSADFSRRFVDAFFDVNKTQPGCT